MKVGKTILIVGATGFIGQRLIRDFDSQDFVIKAAVRVKKDGLPRCAEQIIIGDLLESPSWQSALQNLDTVIQLASKTSVDKHPTAQTLYVLSRLNVDETRRLAQAAVQAGVRRFIFVSSVKVLAERSVTPFTETMQPAPEDAYGHTKWGAEQALLEISSESEMDTVIIRPPMVYGPGAKGNIESLARLVKTGLPLPLGGIENKRSVCAVGNLSDFIQTAISHPGAANETFLVADDARLSTSALIRLIAVASGKRARLFPLPPQLIQGVLRAVGKASMADRIYGDLEVDTSKARDVLNWRPRQTTGEGVEEMVG